MNDQQIVRLTMDESRRAERLAERMRASDDLLLQVAAQLVYHQETERLCRAKSNAIPLVVHRAVFRCSKPSHTVRFEPTGIAQEAGS